MKSIKKILSLVLVVLVFSGCTFCLVLSLGGAIGGLAYGIANQFAPTIFIADVYAAIVNVESDEQGLIKDCKEDKTYSYTSLLYDEKGNGKHLAEYTGDLVVTEYDSSAKTIKINGVLSIDKDKIKEEFFKSFPGQKECSDYAGAITDGVLKVLWKDATGSDKTESIDTEDWGTGELLKVTNVGDILKSKFGKKNN